ncbi:MAG: alpha/beta fold hydrolase [Anaerolineae bacterium]|nr:alpha/beta fold hydrolase [Phycisphaerae bacterium]
MSMFLIANVAAYMQARSMTRFAPAGVRTASPEQLALASKLRVLLTGVTVPRPVNDQTPADQGLSFATFCTQSSGGIDLELWHIAATPSSANKSRTMILLFHAYASSKEMMLPVARVLHDLGYDTLLVDFRGCGGSTGDETTVGYSEADDVMAATKFAREHFSPERIVLLGDSMGAAAVLRAASLDPKLADALIVDAPFDRLLSTVENRFTPMKFPSFPFARLIVFWGGTRQGYWAFAHNPADYAGKITCPVLHLHGENDPRVTLAQARGLFDRLAGSKAFVLFHGAGHASHVETDRALWTQSVRNFLGAVDGAIGNADRVDLR